MNILVTGGLGFIGSHTVVELAGKGHSVIIADNLVNAKLEVLAKLEKITGQKFKFYQYDVTVQERLEEIFEAEKIDGIIHFAGLKAVGESVEKPLAYYRNNLLSTILLCQMAVKYQVPRLVFSSSATVYGDQEVPFREEQELKKTTNPYGETKAMSERIITDAVNAHPEFSATLLRYFNPVGAHQSGLIGEDPNGIPNNLMPFITKVAKGQLKQLSVYGDDYDTVDGTGVRDYIHVVDLAKAHLVAIEKMQKGINVYNIGTGKGTSVLEMVNSFIKENGVDVPYVITERRAGDIATCYADTSKAERELGWKAEKGVADMVRDAWHFEKNN